MEGTWKDEDGQKREKEGLVTQLLSNRNNNLTAYESHAIRSFGFY